MVFRQTYSHIDNTDFAKAESTLEAVLVINNLRMGRVQGIRRSMQAQPRPVTEMGTDRGVEYVPGIKMFQGSLQTVTIRYGNLVRRLASMSGGLIDGDSKAATISNMPEFDIVVVRRKVPQFGAPEMYNVGSTQQDLAGGGKPILTLVGCVIENFEQALNVNDSLIMESVSIKYIDENFGEYEAFN
jgi:hypothetical protein